MKKEIIKNLWGLIKELNNKEKKSTSLEITKYKKGLTASINCNYEISNSYYSIGEIGNKKDIIGTTRVKKGASKADIIGIVNGLDIP